MLAAIRAPAQQPTILYPPPDDRDPIVVSASQSQRWRQGQVDLWHFSGNVQIRQGNQQIDADEMVVWADLNDPDQLKRLVVYAEGHAVVQWNAAAEEKADRLVDDSWLGRLATNAAFDVRAPGGTGSSGPPPDIVARAEAAHRQSTPDLPNELRLGAETPQRLPAQSTSASGAIDSSPPPEPFVPPPEPTRSAAGSMMISPQNGAILPSLQQNTPFSQAPAPPPNAGPPPQTRLEIHPRQPSVPLNLKTIPSDVPGEQILVANGGVRITIDSSELAQMPELSQEPSSRVYILADNVVAWSNSLNPAQPNPDNVRWEVYLEGNIVFAVGRRTIYADRMYYDATYKRGTILRAEFYTPVQDYRGLVRLKADVLQQLDDNNFQAFGAALTSSRLGVPRYWLQSDRLSVQGVPRTGADPASGMPILDPQTGQPVSGNQYFAESTGNRVYLANMPIFYWPRFRTSLDDPNFYVKSINVGNDDIFGVQVRTRVDMYQLLGFRRPVPGTSWTGALDILSDRGVGAGSEYEYELPSLWGVPSPSKGFYRSWFISDSGADNLGADRRVDPFEDDLRGLVFWNHRQQFSSGWLLRAELGYISDRNFLEQYYEQNWDWDKDWTTGLQLERLSGNRSLNFWGQIHINDFFTQTTWAPRFDHHILGQSLLADRLVYFGHSHIGYAQFEPTVPPFSAVDQATFQLLAWETNPAHGVRAGTRQELDVPLKLGPVKFVPYVLGDATFWEQDLDANSLFRVYGQTGARASLPFWRIDPTIQSTLFNVNGLAHKVSLDAEFAYADASQNFDRLPLYDPLDDDSQEFFRRRFAFQTFDITPGTFIPTPFDERDYARRYGIQSYVSSPTAEIADDLMTVRLGTTNRWQTKRGLPGRENVIDWVTLNSGITIFPRPDEDNFGEVLGLLNYNYCWFIGDRLSILSDGYADFFSQGLKTVSLGADLHRPGNGDLYLGVRSIEGPISSNIITGRLTYRMSDKWGMQALSAYDFGSTGNIGQRVALFYIGESFLFRFGVSYDVSRDNLGFLFGIEPRFLAQPQLFRPGGVPLAPASAEFLE